MLYYISIGRTCPRCTPKNIATMTEDEYEEYIEYQFELTEEHRCPFKSHDRKGNQWVCNCCTICEHYCSKFYRKGRSNELRHEIKAVYGVWL